MADKTLIESKSVWFNGLSILALVVTDMMANDAIREMIGAKIFYLMITGSIINMIIRFYTVKPVVIKRSKPPSRLDVLEENQADDNYMKDF